RTRDNNKLPYREMPAFLKQFGYYVDEKYDYSHPPNLVHEHSCTGLQASACGLDVYHNNHALTEFPEEHKASNVAKLFLKALENN
ncbi:MAG: hypothetical protein ACE5H1_01760, partial [Thermodesulfobacteriota bacterium]